LVAIDENLKDDECTFDDKELLCHIAFGEEGKEDLESLTELLGLEGKDSCVILK
jgi:hypothetical protein